MTNEDLNEDQLFILNRRVTDQYFKYKLMGVVVHNGTSESGHYYSFIKDREQAYNGSHRSAAGQQSSQKDGEGWYEFNDTRVNYFNAKDIPYETFGGENENYDAEMRQYAGDAAMQQIMAS